MGGVYQYLSQLGQKLIVDSSLRHSLCISSGQIRGFRDRKADRVNQYGAAAR